VLGQVVYSILTTTKFVVAESGQESESQGSIT
jgi:hypothetical protein